MNANLQLLFMLMLTAFQILIRYFKKIESRKVWDFKTET